MSTPTGSHSTTASRPSPDILDKAGASASHGSTQARFQVFPIEHWSLLRLELLWAFDAPLMESALNSRYFPYPTAAWFIRRGELTLRFPSGEEQYTAGQWVFPRQMSGRQIFSDDAELLSLRFYAEWRNGRPLFPRNESVSFQQKEAPLLISAAEPLAHFIQTNLPTAEERTILPLTHIDHFMTLQSLFANWIKAYYQTFVTYGFIPEVIPPMGDVVRSAIVYLQSRPLNLPFHEKEVADHVGLSLSHLNRLFSKQARMTPYEFLTYRRIEAAQVLLLGGKEHIKQISHSLGFATPEAFTRWFRKQSGYSPRLFRKILR